MAAVALLFIEGLHNKGPCMGNNVPPQNNSYHFLLKFFNLMIAKYCTLSLAFLKNYIPCLSNLAKPICIVY